MMYLVMVIILPLTYACIPTPIRDETPEIPLTTRRPPPPPCSSCPTPVQTIDIICRELTITPCDQNNRLIYDCGDCVLSTQNEPTDAFINRGQVPADITCDSSSGRYYIGTPADQIRVLRCD